MEKRKIENSIYNKVIKDIPKCIIEMLPEKPENLLSDEEYLKTFYYVMAITFYNKTPVRSQKCI